MSKQLGQPVPEKQTVKAVYENGVFRPTTLVLNLPEGQEVVVTVQVCPKLSREEEQRRAREVVRRMKAEGFLDTEPFPVSGPPPADWRPPVIEGEPLSETIIKMRRGDT